MKNGFFLLSGRHSPGQNMPHLYGIAGIIFVLNSAEHFIETAISETVEACPGKLSFTGYFPKQVFHHPSRKCATFLRVPAWSVPAFSTGIGQYPEYRSFFEANKS